MNGDAVPIRDRDWVREASADGVGITRGGVVAGRCPMPSADSERGSPDRYQPRRPLDTEVSNTSSRPSSARWVAGNVCKPQFCRSGTSQDVDRKIGGGAFLLWLRRTPRTACSRHCCPTQTPPAHRFRFPEMLRTRHPAVLFHFHLPYIRKLVLHDIGNLLRLQPARRSVRR